MRFISRGKISNSEIFQSGSWLSVIPLLNYRKLSGKPSIFRSFTGLEVSEFDSLQMELESTYDEYEEKRLSRRDRKRRIGAGRPFKLSLKDRLLMLLVYYRLYITSTLTGFLFDLDQSNVLKNIRILEPLMKECIPLSKKLYENARRARSSETDLDGTTDRRI